MAFDDPNIWEPIENTSTLRGGDVLLVSDQRIDRNTSREYLVRHYRCVAETPKRRTMKTALLRPDFDKERHIHITRVDDHAYVARLHPDNWPEAVVQIRMKLLAQGVIQLDI